jgi:YD repeat-containing protein
MDSLGGDILYVYDSQNRLVAVTKSAGGTARYAGDTQHRMTSIPNRQRTTVVQNCYDVKSHHRRLGDRPVRQQTRYADRIPARKKPAGEGQSVPRPR